MTANTPERLSDECHAAQAVADAVGAYLASLQAATGLHPSVVLAGAHAQVVAMMTATLGGPTTSAACKQAASRIVDTPSAAACALAFGPTAGRA